MMPRAKTWEEAVHEAQAIARKAIEQRDELAEALRTVIEVADADGGVIANGQLEWIAKARAALSKL